MIYGNFIDMFQLPAIKISKLFNKAIETISTESGVNCDIQPSILD